MTIDDVDAPGVPVRGLVMSDFPGVHRIGNIDNEQPGFAVGDKRVLSGYLYIVGKTRRVNKRYFAGCFRLSFKILDSSHNR